MRKPVVFLLLGMVSLLATFDLAIASEDDAARRRAYLEKAFETANVFPGATVEDFLYPEPAEEKALFAPQYEPWVEVFRFPISESPYAYGVAYSKNADEDRRYAVSTGIDPRPMIRFYNKDGEQTDTCDQQNSTGFGLLDLAYDESRNEFHGGGGIGVSNRRRVFLDNCRTTCERSCPGLPYHLATAHHDGGTDPDTVWGTYWFADFRCYTISMPTCAYTDEGYLMSNDGRGACLGLAIGMDGTIGEPWVLWCAYQTGPAVTASRRGREMELS